MNEDVIIVEKLNNTYFEITCNIEQALELKSYFQCHKDKYWFNPKYKAGIWDGIISYFNMYDRTFPIGLLPYFNNFLKKYNYKCIYNFDKENFYNSISKSNLQDLYKVIFKHSEFHPRDYQDEAVYRLLNKKRGVVEIATGLGKSLIIYSIIRFLMGTVDKKILLIVPSIALTNQMFNEFEEKYGMKNASEYFSILYGGSKKYDKNKKNLISTWQSIYNKREKFFEDFDAVLIDETHSAKDSSSIQKILKKCTNAEYRFGFTGTLPTVPVDVFNIYGYIGPKLLDVTAKEGQEKGFLADIKIANLLIRYEKEEIEQNKKIPYVDEYNFVITHKKRNNVIKYIINNINTNDNVLILAQRLEHIDKIYDDLYEEYGKTHIFYKIDGRTNPDERERIRKSINNQSKVIMVCSYGTMSTGININKIHHIVFASSYKAKIKVLQSIGRGLRTHESKKKLILWDMVDDLRWKSNRGNVNENTLFKHFKVRLSYYKKNGFKYVNKIVKLLNL